MSAIKDDSLFKIYLLAADGAYVNQDSHKAGLRAVAEAAVKDAVGGEPVAWMYTDRFGTHFTEEKDEWYSAEGIESVQPLYTRPQASAAVLNAVGQLKSVLCDAEGSVCISGSDADRQIIQNALLSIAGGSK